MKKSKKKLSLKKKTVFNLNKDQMDNVKGGADIDFPTFNGMCTSGCTDGCTGSDWFCTAWNCTRGGCTDDCKEDQLLG